MTELLCPAGNMERLQYAVHYGADAVYMGGENFSLRAFSENFDAQQLADAVQYLHARGKKAYITCNIFAHYEDIAAMGDYLRYLHQIRADAVLVADLGVLKLAKQVAPELVVHISTQANTTNALAARAYYEMGASRVVLARELSIEEIRRLRDQIPPELELEAFVHGAMCISYSGRCLLSSYLTGRDSNRGRCAQPCRWAYTIREQSREEELPILEDERGTYILNSKDLCMAEHLRELKDAGVDSFKIEGRMKTVYYAAVVTNAYRRAMDAMLAGELAPSGIVQELEKAANREFTTGFYFGKPDEHAQRYVSSKCVQSYEFVAVVRGSEQGRVLLEQRNKFSVGDELEVLSAGEMNGRVFTVSAIDDAETGEAQASAPNPQQLVYVPCGFALAPMDILRRKQA